MARILGGDDCILQDWRNISGRVCAQPLPHAAYILSHNHPCRYDKTCDSEEEEENGSDSEGATYRHTNDGSGTASAR